MSDAPRYLRRPDLDTAGATPAPRPADDEPDEYLFRVEVERTDLGEGLARLLAVWKGREHAGDPAVDLGLCHVFELALEGKPVGLEIEIDDNAREWLRRVHIVWPSGTVDSCNTARQLLELARLLRRDEVFAALGEWAAEDAAADAADAAGRKGGRL